MWNLRILGICFLTAALLVGCGSEPQESDAVYQGKTSKQWIQELPDRDPAVARAAIEALVALGADAIPTLLKGLKSDNPDMRAYSAAVLGLNESSGEDAARAVIELLTDAEKTSKDGRTVATAAVLGLAEMDASITIPLLLETLRDKDPAMRMVTLACLSRIDEQHEIVGPAIVELLDDDGVLDDSMLEGQEPHPVWEYAKQALHGMYGDAVPALVDALGHKNPTVRARSAETLGEIGWFEAQDAEPALMEALQDSDRDVREAAKNALAEFEKQDRD